MSTTNEERLKRLEGIKDVTSLKIEKKMNEIKEKVPALQEAIKMLEEAKKANLSVERFFKVKEYGGAYIDHNLFILNLGDRSKERYIIDEFGDFYSSTYASSYTDGKIRCSDSFKLTALKNSTTSEEYRKKRLEDLVLFLGMIDKTIFDIYNEIDCQISIKEKEIKELGL